MFIKEILSKKFIEEYFHRNKNLIILSATIFILSVLLGAIFNESIKQLATEIIKKMLEEIPMESVSENALNLFINNIIANLTILFGGLLFSILSVFAILVNGLLIGYVYSIATPTIFFVGTIPHGIFEITAIILSLTGAFILTKTELIIIQALFSKRLHEELDNIKVYIKDVVFTIVVTFILLVIAAIIEAAITPALLHMVI